MWCWWQTLVRRVVAADRAHSRLTFSHYQVGSSVGRARGAYDILDYDLMPKHARHGLYRAPDPAKRNWPSANHTARNTAAGISIRVTKVVVLTGVDHHRRAAVAPEDKAVCCTRNCTSSASSAQNSEQKCSPFAVRQSST